MHLTIRKPRLIAAGLAVITVAVAGAVATGAAASGANSYTVTKLVSDQPGVAPTTDPNLVNSWGIAAGPTSPWWVADNGTDRATLYDGNGVPQFQPTPLVVKVEGGPTGTVFNGGSGFVVSDGRGHSGPARFMFATEEGKIRGWNPNVPPPSPSTHAPVVVNRSGEGAIYKGLAIAGSFIYAADFHNARVDVFDSNFHLVTTPGAFTDPSLPAHFAPFGIQNINGNIFVTYAMQDQDAEDEVDGPHLGIVDEYSPTGAFIVRVATGGDLNAPWGLAWAPEDFGAFGGDLLVGNFGDGRINAYAMQSNGTFTHAGTLHLPNGHPLIVDGLWGIGFGNGSASGDTDDLYFAAGPDDEMHGLFGEISAAS
jgi:uncharacterized protein (TIGR03118 family)